MAILKDLIVHGSSRFLNKIYASELETPLISADVGVFKKLTAKDLTAETATVIGLLDVQGQLHTNTWTNSNIATIDGCFYITPTLSSDSGTISFSSTSVASLTGTYAAVTSLYIGDSSSGSTVQWTKDSKVLLTGEVKVNGQWLPLGTLLGTLSANATTSSIGLTGLTDNRHNTSSIITDIRNAVSNASLNYRNLKISLYQRKDGTDSKPLGIYMTAMGANGKTFIDIYGGVNATTTAGSSGGFADPNLRIGNLSGLGAVEGNTPQGWGIYTTNGYFKGVVVSSAGNIGGWNLTTDSIWKNNQNFGNASGMYFGASGISLGSTFKVTNAGVLTTTAGTIAGWRIESSYLASGTATSPAANVLLLSPAGTSSSYTVAGQAKTGWMITAGTSFGVNKDGGVYATAGKIGGWTIGTSSLYNSKSSYNNSNEGLYLGTDYIAGGAGEEWWLKKDGSAKIGAMTLSAAGVLTVPAANVSGKLTAATIDGTQITANTITADQIATGAIKTDELDANAVTSAKIKAGEVKATNIASSAVTADKLDATTINASNKLTVGALTTTDQNNILNSNIQIGGRNLFRYSHPNNTYWWNQNSSNATINKDKITITQSGEFFQRYNSLLYSDEQIIPAGTQLTLSCYFYENTIADGNHQIYYADQVIRNGARTTAWLYQKVPINYTGLWSVTFTTTEDISGLYIEYDTRNMTSGKWVCGPCKLEIGNKATTWSPAPEDLDVHKYVTDIDSNKGITIKPADTSGNDYLQMNSSAINFYRNNVETLKIEDSAIRVGKLGNNLRNVYITDSAVQIRNNTSVLAEYGSSIKLYQPTTTTVAVEISSTGATFTGNVKATSLSTGTKTAATTGKGTFINSDGAIYVGNGSTNNFTVTDTGTITATGANLLTATVGNATNKITIGTGTSGHSSVRYGMTTLADTTNNGFYIGTDGIALGKGAFKVTAAGALTATSGSISGGIVTNGIDAGNITVGTLAAERIDVSSLSIGISQVTNLQTTLNGKQPSGDYATNTALTNATGWNVILNISAIDYTANTAILKATVYKDGVVQTSGFTLQWYKTETSTSTTPQVTKTSLLTGQTSDTLEIKTSPTGDAYADTLDASYTCIVS